MKSLLFGGAALVAIAMSAPAFAASPAPDVTWTGAYIGVHAGYGWESESWTQTTSSLALALDRSASDVKMNGITGGAQIGYDYQSGPWVIGARGDWSWNDQKGAVDHVVFTSYAGRTDNDWTATVAARGGYAAGRALVYVVGGAAFAHDVSAISFTGADVASVSNTRVGWVAGAGIQTALTPRWSVGLEYNYMNFGTEKTSFTYSAHPAGLIEGWNLKADDQVIKASLNYRFGGM